MDYQYIGLPINSVVIMNKLEQEYNNLDKESKDKAILFSISQITLVILGLLIGFAATTILSKSISLPISKIILIVIMMFICLAIYAKALGSVNNK